MQSHSEQTLLSLLQNHIDFWSLVGHVFKLSNVQTTRANRKIIPIDLYDESRNAIF